MRYIALSSWYASVCREAYREHTPTSATTKTAPSAKLAERLHAAEAAIFERLQKLSINTAPEGERVALDEAIRRLHMLKREKLRSPQFDLTNGGRT